MAELHYDEANWTPGHNPWLVALTVTLATFMEVLDTSIANVALPHMAGSLGASEEVLGRAIKDFASGRESVVLATKVYFPLTDGPNRGGLSRKHILAAIDASLTRLKTDYVDL